MPGLILHPSQFVDVKGPVIYLAGPIQGTWNWRAEAVAHIHDLDPHIHIANPRANRFSGNFGEQVSWCEHYQDRAAEDGAILFWFSAESKHRCDRAYAQEARFELGERLARSWTDGTRIAVGFERGFTGSYFLREKLPRHYAHVPICRSLRQLCAAAVELARHRSMKWASVRERML